MDGFWDEIENEIRDCVKQHGSVTVAELARQLRMSESATASVLRVLVPNGGVQMSIRLTDDSRARRTPPRPAA